MSHPGKKVGTLVIHLDRVVAKVRWGMCSDHKAKFVVDLRLDTRTGVFHAQYDGVWYSAKTQAELHDQIKASVKHSVELVWERYIVISYDATVRRLNKNRLDENSYITYSIDMNHSRKRTVTGIDLTWSVVDYTQPWTRPEDRVSVRSKRELSYDADSHTEHLGDPHEQKDDSLPAGAVLWTAEREQFLHDVLEALGKLDTRMVALFGGAPDELARKIDVIATSGHRLLEPGDDYHEILKPCLSG